MIASLVRIPGLITVFHMHKHIPINVSHRALLHISFLKY